MNEINIEKEKNCCKTMGIIGLITSFIIGILSLPFNIIAIVKGSKVKKVIGKTETGFILGIIGIIISLIIVFIQICLITAVLNFTKFAKQTKKENELNKNKYLYDIVEKNKAYFGYSLGQYTYDYETYNTDCHYIDSTAFNCKIARQYSIKYDEGKILTIRTGNYIEKELEREILNILNEQFKNNTARAEILKRFYNSKLYSNEEKFYENSPYVDVTRINENIKYSDSSSGVRIKNLNFRNMKDNNLMLIVGFDFYYDGNISEYPLLKDEIIRIFEPAFNTFEKDNLKILINVHHNLKNQTYEEIEYELIFNNGKYELIEK